MHLGAVLETDILGLLATTIITGVSTWILARPKEKKEQVDSLLIASKEFRDEVRKDLLDKRAENDALKEQIKFNLTVIHKISDKNHELINEINNLKKENANLKDKLMVVSVSKLNM